MYRVLRGQIDKSPAEDVSLIPHADIYIHLILGEKPHCFDSAWQELMMRTLFGMKHAAERRC